MQTEFNLLKLCRVCGCACENSINMFEKMHKQLVRQVEDIIGDKLKCGKYLPKMMCANCHTQLQSSYDFRQLCLQSQAYFASQKFKEQVKNSTHTMSSPATGKGLVENKEEEAQNVDELEKTPQIEFIRIQENDKELHEDHRKSPSLQTNEPTTKSLTSEPNFMNIDRGKHEEELKSAAVKGRPPKIAQKSKKTTIRIEDPIICEQCGNQFSCRNQFINHQKRHIGEKPFQCEICSNKFFTHSELKRHMRRHTGERPFPCRHCNRRFTDYSTRLKHERTHTNERPYTCLHCGKAFTTTYILKNHVLTHTGQREFSCKICNKYFVRHTHLVVHCRSLMHKQNEEKCMGTADGTVYMDSAENNT